MMKLYLLYFKGAERFVNDAPDNLKYTGYNYILSGYHPNYISSSHLHRRAASCHVYYLYSGKNVISYPYEVKNIYFLIFCRHTCSMEMSLDYSASRHENILAVS